MGLGIGPLEMLIFGTIALLLFGSRLPEVARSFGKSIVEFKKGMRGIEDDIDGAVHRAPTRRPEPIEEERTVSAPKFEPPKSEPN